MSQQSKGACEGQFFSPSHFCLVPPKTGKQKCLINRRRSNLWCHMQLTQAAFPDRYTEVLAFIFWKAKMKNVLSRSNISRNNWDWEANKNSFHSDSDIKNSRHKQRKNWHLQLACGCTKFTVNAKAIASGQAELQAEYSCFNTQLLGFLCQQVCIWFSQPLQIRMSLCYSNPPLPVRNLSDNDVSHLSRTEVGRGWGVHCCWSMNTQELQYTLYSQCVQNQIQFSPPHSSPMFERTQSYSEINRHDTVGIHLLLKHDDCVTVVQKLLRCSAVGDDERDPKGWDWSLLGNQTVPFSRDIYTCHRG